MVQELLDEIEKTAKAVVDQIHTAIPGKVVEFDANKGLAAIQPCGKFVTSDGKELDYPQITEVPIVLPYCTTVGVGIAFPIKKDDSGIVIVSEVELDAWRSGAESEGSLRFDLTSAVFVPGLMPCSSDLISKAVLEDSVVIGTSDVTVAVNKDAVTAKVGDSSFKLSNSGVAIGGNLKVKGNISYTGACKQE